eukprot:1071013-Lingulodinium_polyedra.AAC.1
MRKRAINEPLRRQTADSTASLRNVCKTLHNDTAESTVRGRSGSQIARLRTAGARQKIGARTECAN